MGVVFNRIFHFVKPGFHMIVRIVQIAPVVSNNVQGRSGRLYGNITPDDPRATETTSIAWIELIWKPHLNLNTVSDKLQELNSYTGSLADFSHQKMLFSSRLKKHIIYGGPIEISFVVHLIQLAKRKKRS